MRLKHKVVKTFMVYLAVKAVVKMVIKVRVKIERLF